MDADSSVIFYQSILCHCLFAATWLLLNYFLKLKEVNIMNMKKTIGKFLTFSRMLFRAPIMRLLLCGGLLFAIDSSFAADPVYLTDLASNLGKTIINVGKLLVDVALISGIGFVLVSFFKFHAHKNNPQQIPLSQGISLLVIGAGLMVFPYMLQGVAKAGTGHSAATSGGGGITGFIKSGS